MCEGVCNVHAGDSPVPMTATHQPRVQMTQTEPIQV